MSTDKIMQESLQKELNDRKITIDELQDELKEKLAYIQILTVKDLKERGHNFHPCKYTKIVCIGTDGSGKSIGPYVVFNESYSNKIVQIDILNKGTLTFTLHNYDTTKCTQANKSHQKKIAEWYNSDGVIKNISIQGNKISNLTFEYPHTENIILSFASIIPLFLPTNFLSVFVPYKNTLVIPTCRHRKTLIVNVYPKFKAKLSVGIGFVGKSVKSTTMRRTDSGVRIREISESEDKDKNFKWYIGLEAEIGSIKFNLKRDDPVVTTVDKITKSWTKVKKIEEQLASFLDGHPGANTTKKRTLDITYPTLMITGEVESILVGIKRKHEYKILIGLEPLIGIACKIDLLAAAAKMAGPVGLLIKLRDYVESEGWGDLYCDLIIRGEISGRGEFSNTKTTLTITGKISVAIELGLKITLESIKLEASASLSGGIGGKAVFNFTGGISVSANVGNEDLGLTAIFKVKFKIVIKLEFKQVFDLVVLKKNTIYHDFGTHVIK